MSLNINRFLGIAATILFLSACGERQERANEHNGNRPEEVADHGEQEEGQRVHLSAAQMDSLNMKIDSLVPRSVPLVVQASGQLEVPPQNEATVTPIIGANVSSIRVIEGDEVKKGQVLAYLSHPDITRLQGDYLAAYNNLQFLEQDFQRQKRLYEAEVSSGKTFQQTQADYRSTLGIVKSLESQLRQFGMNPSRIREGNFYDRIPVVSPIDGSVVNVAIKTGQFVQPEKGLFEIVNTQHIHADLMVFEKDIYKVQDGQRVKFKVETLPGKELEASIYSVGKKFEQDPKAVHVHAEIEGKTGRLIPGMYIKGEILTDSTEAYALPETAVIREGDKYLAFLAEKEVKGANESWIFTPVEVKAGIAHQGWIAIEIPQNLREGTLFAMNNAYYLIAEMNKSEAGHSH